MTDPQKMPLECDNEGQGASHLPSAFQASIFRQDEGKTPKCTKHSYSEFDTMLGDISGKNGSDDESSLSL